MDKPTSFAAIASLWSQGGSRFDTVRRFADAIGQPWQTVYKWAERDFIDLRYWNDVIAAVKAHRGMVLSHADLHAMAMQTLDARDKDKARKREAA
jgi:hypothetical protein